MTTDEEGESVAALLREIRDNQRLQLERQAEALALQREQLALVRTQYERTAQLQDRAERLQQRSGELVERGRKVFAIILPVLVILLLYVTWLMVR